MKGLENTKHTKNIKDVRNGKPSKHIDHGNHTTHGKHARHAKNRNPMKNRNTGRTGNTVNTVNTLCRGYDEGPAAWLPGLRDAWSVGVPIADPLEDSDQAPFEIDDGDVIWFKLNRLTAIEREGDFPQPRHKI